MTLSTPAHERKAEDGRYYSGKEEGRFDPSQIGKHDKVLRHPRWGKCYVDEKNKVLYTKDRAGHGGEHWKKYIENGGKWRHEADVDMTGKVMNKNKGPIGVEINKKDLIGIK